ncbi:MAG: alanine racemase [Verrucomicrobiota bacterium]
MRQSKHRCWAMIDLAAFERNLKRIQRELPQDVAYIAVVKADAYGHGTPHIVRRLMQSGVDCFAVANVKEASVIRHMGGGWPILLLSPVLPGEEDAVIDQNLIATVSSSEELLRLNTLAKKRGARIQIHVKIDTGMGRLGVWHEEASVLLRSIPDYPQIELAGIYTHFSSADTDASFTFEQRERFLKLLKGFNQEGLTIHADNSAGIDSLHPESPFNAVRVGLLQFGIPPYPESVLGQAAVEPVFSFHTRIGLVKELPEGTDISYQRTHRLKRDSRIAVLTAGYGDGIPIELSNKGHVLLQGQRCPIIGRVTMDQTIIDITDLEEVPGVGDCVVLIGTSEEQTIRINEFSSQAGSIPWESLCSITKRVERVYVGSREI